MQNELLSLALVGTAHGKTDAVPLPGQLEEAASAIKDPSAEQSLLSRSALLNSYLRCGIKAASGVPLPVGAEGENLHCCSIRAADLLADLLRDRDKQLIAEWLAFSVKLKQRAPHRLLFQLIDLAAEENFMRDAVAIVSGARGRWLMSQNADWALAANDNITNQERWETGTPAQRLLVLRQARETDPSQARELLQKSWKDDPADQRVEFLKLFIIGLSLSDESLLESFLDDRSKIVRAAAADLLSRLPQSQFVQRMIARTLPLLTFKFKLVKGVKLEVVLPTELDKAAQRDIIEKTVPQGTGEKQWWLGQMLSFVPLSTWVAASGSTPTDIIFASAKNDFGPTILRGFTTAAERNPESIWIDPLLRHGLADGGRLSRVLLDALIGEQFLALAVELLQDKHLGLPACSDLINNENVPLDIASGRLWIQTVAKLIERGGPEQWTILCHLPLQCGMRLPPTLGSELKSLWNVERQPWSQHRSSIEKMLTVLETRRQIEKEFS